MRSIGSLYANPDTAKLTKRGTMLAALTELRYAIGFQYLHWDKFINPKTKKWIPYHSMKIGSFAPTEYPIYAADTETIDFEALRVPTILFLKSHNQFFTKAAMKELKGPMHDDPIIVDVFRKSSISQHRSAYYDPGEIPSKSIYDVVTLKPGDSFIAAIAIEDGGYMYLFQPHKTKSDVNRLVMKSRIWLSDWNDRDDKISKEFREYGGIAQLTVEALDVDNSTMEVYLKAVIHPFYLPTNTPIGFAKYLQENYKQFSTHPEWAHADYFESTLNCQVINFGQDVWKRTTKSYPGFAKVQAKRTLPAKICTQEYGRVLWYDGHKINSLPFCERATNDRTLVAENAAWLKWAVDGIRCYRNQMSDFVIARVSDNVSPRIQQIIDNQKAMEYREGVLKTHEILILDAETDALNVQEHGFRIVSKSKFPIYQDMLRENRKFSEKFLNTVPARVFGCDTVGNIITCRIMFTLQIDPNCEVLSDLYQMVALLCATPGTLRFYHRQDKSAADELLAHIFNMGRFDKALQSIWKRECMNEIILEYNERVITFQDSYQDVLTGKRTFWNAKRYPLVKNTLVRKPVNGHYIVPIKTK